MPISNRYSAVHVVMSDYMRPIYMYCFMCSLRTSTGLTMYFIKKVVFSLHVVVACSLMLLVNEKTTLNIYYLLIGGFSAH